MTSENIYPKLFVRLCEFNKARTDSRSDFCYRGVSFFFFVFFFRFYFLPALFPLRHHHTNYNYRSIFEYIYIVHFKCTEKLVNSFKTSLRWCPVFELFGDFCFRHLYFFIQFYIVSSYNYIWYSNEMAYIYEF